MRGFFFFFIKVEVHKLILINRRSLIRLKIVYVYSNHMYSSNKQNVWIHGI